MWISPKPMVDGFVKIFDEFRNGCDEKAIRYRHTPPIALIRNSNPFALEFANLFENKTKKNFANSSSGKLNQTFETTDSGKQN